jgi:hypothetical protein
LRISWALANGQPYCRYKTDSPPQHATLPSRTVHAAVEADLASFYPSFSSSGPRRVDHWHPLVRWIPSRSSLLQTINLSGSAEAVMGVWATRQRCPSLSAGQAACPQPYLRCPASCQPASPPSRYGCPAPPGARAVNWHPWWRYELKPAPATRPHRGPLRERHQHRSGRVAEKRQRLSIGC